MATVLHYYTPSGQVHEAGGPGFLGLCVICMRLLSIEFRGLGTVTPTYRRP